MKPMKDPVAAAPDQGRDGLLDELLNHRDSVLWLCLGYARDPVQAEELAQEAYLKALKSVGSLKDHRAAKVWLCRIAKHTCLDYLKRERIGREAVMDCSPRTIEDRSPETLVLEREQQQLIKKSIRRLPRNLRDVFIMREYAELTYEEIARVSGRRIGTVMSRLNRARRALAGLVREEEHGT